MLEQSTLKEFLSYNPETGLFTWLISRGTAKAGAIAGSVSVDVNGRKYIRLRINKQQYKAHRLAWLYMTGEWPENLVDHKDGDGLNNVWSNLRKATKSENNHNQVLNANNTSGVKGVYWHKNIKKWRAQIVCHGKNKHVGYFDSIPEAQSAIQRVREELHGEFTNHG